jgi:hemolysin III
VTAAASHPGATPAAAPDGARAEGRPLLRGWLHATALVPAVVATSLLAAHGHGRGQQAALALYAAGLTALFGVSASFHRIRWSPAARRRMRRADHGTIFLAIAGTYTAVAVLALRGWARTSILCVVWVGAAAGAALRQLWLDAPKWAVALPYVVVGWCAVIVLPQLWRGLGPAGFALLVAGGCCYSVGAVVYARRRPSLVPHVFGYHELFHALTIVGAALQFAAVAAYALPRS